jgi:asparagine synthase (glutamine-hydrolysing)
MCSIFGIFEIAAGVDLRALRQQALSQSARQRHRGPDWSGVYVDDRAVLAHERLAIVDVSSGAQPLRSADGGLALAVNGEIYNHRELRLEVGDRYDFQTESSIACSSAAAIDWDPAFAKAADPSGRAVAGVHLAAKDPLDLALA